MELQVFHRTFLTHSKTKSQKQVVFQTKIPSTKELSFVRTTKFMLTDMKMTLPIFTTCKLKLGPRSEIK